MCWRWLLLLAGVSAAGALAGCTVPRPPQSPVPLAAPPATSPCQLPPQPEAVRVPVEMADEPPAGGEPQVEICPPVPDPIGERIAEEVSPALDPGRRALEVARRLLGTPYSFGGESPEGFDCSGLVHYAFRQAGIELPRSSRDQFGRVHPVELDRLQPGDLLFFRLSRQRISHVGIYAEADLFIHAPSFGKNVSYASLADPFWRPRLVGAGRVQAETEGED